MSLKIQGEEPEEARSFPINIGLLFLRFAMVCSLFYYELALHLGKAWNRVWKEEEWGLVDQFNNLNLPLPGALAVTTILAAVLASAGVVLGFLGRINGLIVVLILGFFLIAGVKTSENLTPEAIVVYLIILVALIVTGPGSFSLDHVLTKRAGLRKA